MRLRKKLFVSLLCAVVPWLIFALTAPAFASRTSCATITSVAHEKDNASERVVISLDHPVAFKSAHLGKSRSGKLPWRLYVDIADACLGKSIRKTIHPDSPRILAIRIGNHDTATVRMVLDLANGITRSEYSILLDTERSVLTIDLPFPKSQQPQKTARQAQTPLEEHAPRAVPAQSFTDSNPSSLPHPPPAAPSESSSTAGHTAPADHLKRQDSAPAPKKSSQNPGQCVIVIDPGHGGKDPGAIGYNGIEEKTVCLSLALALKKVLDNEAWCKTFLTRSTDKFVSLQRRAQIANSRNADFFISIHANSHEDETLTGIETYYLNFSSDADARKVAARENFTTPDAIGDLEIILFDLLQSDKINKSSILAGHIHNALITRLKQRYTEVRNLGIKHAPMRVLIDAEMPCVIIEAAFISNPAEAMLLKNNEHQRLIARAIAEGLRNFKNVITSAANANARRDM